MKQEKLHALCIKSHYKSVNKNRVRLNKNEMYNLTILNYNDPSRFNYDCGIDYVITGVDYVYYYGDEFFDFYISDIKDIRKQKINKINESNL